MVIHYMIESPPGTVDVSELHFGEGGNSLASGFGPRLQLLRRFVLLTVSAFELGCK